eukprot:jgi/Chrzof1/12800/Cz07g07300.t1
MDRWADADDDTPSSRQRPAPLGNVAQHGISAFVKAGVAPPPEGVQQHPKIQVVQSRREQRAAADKVAMAPPPPVLLPHSATACLSASSSSFTPPAWAVAPPPGAALHVIKDGEVIQRIALDKVAVTFGRLPDNDVILEHASISRHHAAICFQASTGTNSSSTSSSTSRACMVLDLGSAHGTFLDGRRVAKDAPAVLSESSSLRFGASSRTYVLTVEGSKPNHKPSELDAEISANGAAAKRQRVSAPDDTDAGSTMGRADQVGNVPDDSERGTFFPRVGPMPVAGGDDVLQQQGKFSDLVQVQTVPSDKTPHSKTSEAHDTGGRQTLVEDSQQWITRGIQPKLQRFIHHQIKVPPPHHHLSNSGIGASLYEKVPPPSK